MSIRSVRPPLAPSANSIVRKSTIFLAKSSSIQSITLVGEGSQFCLNMPFSACQRISLSLRHVPCIRTVMMIKHNKYIFFAISKYYQQEKQSSNSSIDNWMQTQQKQKDQQQKQPTMSANIKNRIIYSSNTPSNMTPLHKNKPRLQLNRDEDEGKYTMPTQCETARLSHNSEDHPFYHNQTIERTNLIVPTKLIFNNYGDSQQNVKINNMGVNQSRDYGKEYSYYHEQSTTMDALDDTVNYDDKISQCSYTNKNTHNAENMDYNGSTVARMRKEEAQDSKKQLIRKIRAQREINNDLKIKIKEEKERHESRMTRVHCHLEQLNQQYEGYEQQLAMLCDKMDEYERQYDQVRQE